MKQGAGEGWRRGRNRTNKAMNKKQNTISFELGRCSKDVCVAHKNINLKREIEKTHNDLDEEGRVMRSRLKEEKETRHVDGTRQGFRRQRN